MSKTFKRGNSEFSFKKGKSPEQKKKGRDSFEKMAREIIRDAKLARKMLEEV